MLDINYHVLWALSNSLMVPIVFFCIRQSVKRHRQKIVEDLSTIFSKDSAKDGGVIPSFEFLKYKYYINDPIDNRRYAPRDHSISSWVIGAFPLIVILFTLTLILVEAGSELVAAQYRIYEVGPWKLAVAAAFASGYIFMIRGLYRAISNFDLGPATFVGGAISLVSGSVLACFAFTIIPLSGAAFLRGSVLPIYAALLFAFAIGAMPEVALRFLIRRSQLNSYKRENDDIYRSFKTTSIEVIDGIDVEIRDRLADYHIRSVQNLAAANPLMLFVETPYGVYQIMDWVAQAQLCSSVGPKVLVRLWRLGIRTLFDLERAAFSEPHKDEALLLEIGAILFSEHLNGDGKPPLATFRPSLETVIAAIEVRLDDPHVHRLRQIYIQIGDRIGAESRRFPPRSFAWGYQI